MLAVSGMAIRWFKYPVFSWVKSWWIAGGSLRGSGVPVRGHLAEPLGTTQDVLRRTWRREGSPGIWRFLYLNTWALAMLWQGGSWWKQSRSVWRVFGDVLNTCRCLFCSAVQKWWVQCSKQRRKMYSFDDTRCKNCPMTVFPKAENCHARQLSLEKLLLFQISK